MRRLSVMVAGLWWASLCTVGFLVVPMLFVHLPTPAVAGGMAAKLFSAQTWVSAICGLFLLMSGASSRNVGHPRVGPQSASHALMWILAALIASLLLEFAVAPHIVARENLKFWHGAGSGLYLVQCVCTGFIFWKTLPTQVQRAT
ncbi:MAG: hypothetical protein RL459_2289 [Pseudomonadota bacterium]|jgi:hypothetical protein